MIMSAKTWHLPARVDEIPETGRRFALEADSATRDALTRTTGTPGISRLHATFDVTPHGGGVRVVGTVSASVRQTCVVTLEPLDNEIEETVDLIFMPSREGPGDAAARSEAAAGAIQPPEPLVGGVIDLGAVAAEFLVLGIDPYPRKAGAVFAAPSAGDASAHPFAALAALNKSKGDR